jgi:hypothetical protein
MKVAAVPPSAPQLDPPANRKNIIVITAIAGFMATSHILMIELHLFPCGVYVKSMGWIKQ